MSGAAGRSVAAARASGETLKLSQFSPVAELGMGSFGVVKKVRHTGSGEYYAMKVLEKKQVQEKEMQEQLHREVLMQGRMEHPHVVSLLYYFEDKFRIYCLLECADQGNLFAYLRDQVHGLPDSRAGMFFGDSARGVEYLHGLSIVHRDMKPENILLFGKDLRAKLGDFGWCVELTPEVPERTTFCGTMDYIPPEMMLEEPHDLSVDVWALGVLLFEMLLALAPFAAASQKSCFDRICAVKFTIAPGSMSPAAEDLIRRLLLRDKAARLPIKQVLRHQWVVTNGGSARKGEISTHASFGGGMHSQGGDSRKVAFDSDDVLSKTVIHPRRAAEPDALDKTMIAKRPNEPDALDKTMIAKRPPPSVTSVGSGRGPAEASVPGAGGYVSTANAPVESLDATCIVPRGAAAAATTAARAAAANAALAAERAAAAPVAPAPSQPPPEPSSLPFILKSALSTGGNTASRPELIIPGMSSTAVFGDSDLLSSVPDERIDIDELADLFKIEGVTPVARELHLEKKQAEKEFGIDGTRRRTPMMVSPPDAKVTRDATPPRRRDVTPPRFAPTRVGEGTGPKAKRLSRRG